MLNLFYYDFGVRLIKPDPNIYYRTTNTLDFWKHKIVPHPLHMGVGLCYNSVKLI